MPKERVLIVEDSLPLTQIYQAYLSHTDYEVLSAATVEAASRTALQYRPELILLDVELPDGSGIDFLEFINQERLDSRVVVMTAHGSSAMAQAAINLGAVDFLTKPFDGARLLRTLESARQTTSPRQAPLKSEASADCLALQGESDVVLRLNTLINAVASSHAPVCVTARASASRLQLAATVHQRSDRAARAFVTFDCALTEAKQHVAALFGESGDSSPAIVTEANNGTLLLDNVECLSSAAQRQLLGWLKQGYVTIDNNQRVEFNSRVIAASADDLLPRVNTGSFSEDLYYQLNVVTLELPELSARSDDISAVLHAALRQLSAVEGKAFNGFDAEALETLLAYSWPGDLPELQNCLRQIVLVNDAETVTQSMLPKKLLLAQQNALLSESATLLNLDVHQLQRERLTEQDIKPLSVVERLAIEQAIEICSGSINRAANYLDVAPSTIYRKVQQWNKNKAEKEAV